MGVESLLGLVVWLIIVGLIVGVLYWASGFIPEPFGRVARVIIAVIAVIVVINMLLNLLGYGPVLDLRR